MSEEEKKVEQENEIIGGVEIQEEGVEIQLGEQEEEEDDNSQFQEGVLLGNEDLDDGSDSSSELGSEEIDEEEEDLEEEERRRNRRKDKKKKRQKHEDEEEEEEEEYSTANKLEEEEEEEEEEAFNEEILRQRMESIKRLSVKAVISGFDFELSDDESQEEATESSESEPTPLVREPHYAIYLKHMKTYAANKRLNNYLHKKMAEYFKKRKMEHVLLEMAEHIEDAKIKYSQKLNIFEELILYDRHERAKVNKDLKMMKKMAEEQVIKAQTTFNEFINLERDTGVGLINSKTGKEIPAKAVEKLLSNQKNKAKEIQNLRLKHIKIRNAVADKHAAIRALDKIGENYTLMEFEQMKIENAAHIDKIEEKDDELNKIRRKCTGAMQCLAHVREKCYAVEMSIGYVRHKLDKNDTKRIQSREQAVMLKQKRDYLRHETQRIKDVNGLLAKDKLLIDMENSIKETEIIQVDIEKRTKIYDKKKKKLSILKTNYENEKKRRFDMSQHVNVSQTTISNILVKQRTVKTRRPTIMMAEFPQFDY